MASAHPFHPVSPRVSADAPAQIASATGREFLAALDLPADALERIEIALFMVDTLGARSTSWNSGCAGSPATKPAARR